MTYRHDLWEIAASGHGVVTVREAEDAGVPAIEVRKLATRRVLQGYGQGVYRHCDIPISSFTELAIAVALAGEDAFLQRESVFMLHGLGQFNPPQVRVATPRRTRRVLPAWIELERRTDVSDGDIVEYENIASTSVKCALEDMRNRMPPDRWEALRQQALVRELISLEDVVNGRDCV